MFFVILQQNITLTALHVSFQQQQQQKFPELIAGKFFRTELCRHRGTVWFAPVNH